MHRSPAYIVRKIAECFVSYSGGAPASVLQNLVNAGTPENILEIITESPESESSTDETQATPNRLAVHYPS